MTEEVCPSCNGSGAGPTGPYSPRPPRCEECRGIGTVLRCSQCGRICDEEGCEDCAAELPSYPLN